MSWKHASICIIHWECPSSTVGLRGEEWCLGCVKDLQTSQSVHKSLGELTDLLLTKEVMFIARFTV